MMANTFESSRARSRRLVAVILLAVALVGCGSPDGGQPPRPPVEQQIRRFENEMPNSATGTVVYNGKLADRMKFFRIPGVSVALIDDFDVAWAKGYGVLQASGKIPVDERTVFYAASLAKPCAAAVSLALVQRGTLGLTGDVNRWLVSWKVPENDFTRQKPVELQDILSHSAGFSGVSFTGYAAGQPIPTLRQILDGTPPANSPPVRVEYVPGSKFQYSGSGYCVLEQLVADATGKPFPAAAQELVFAPLGMEHATFAQPAEGAPGVAPGHNLSGQPVAWRAFPEAAAAGLWASPTDLARLVLEIQKANVGRQSAVLSQETARAMLTPRLGDAGLGVGLEGSGSAMRFVHAGQGEGYTCYVIAYKDLGKGAVIMTNSGNGQFLIQDIIKDLARIYGWPGL